MNEMMKIPDGWEVTEFKNFVNNKTKKSNSLEYSIIVDLENIEQNNGELIFNSLIRDYPKDKIAFKKKNVLFGKLRPYLRKYWYCTFEGSCTSELLVLEAKKIIESKYVFYVIQNESFLHFADRFSYGTKMPRVSFNDLGKYKCSVPKEKKQQEKIAKILSILDKAIESTNRLIEKEKHIKTALMQELLTNGIDQNGQIRTQQTYTYKPSKLGLIPDEWEVVKIIDFAEVKGGKRLPSDTDFTTESTNYPYIRVTDFLERTIDLKDIKFISKAVQLKIKNYIIDKDDVYISIAGTVGISGVIPEVLHKANLTENAAKICKIKNIDKDFLSFQINSESVQNEIQSYIGAAVQPKLALFRIEKLQIKKPLIEEQKQIAKILITQDKKIETEETNLAKLKELKKGLMNDLLSGTVRVKV